MVASVAARCPQYAGASEEVMPAAPSGEQLAPTTTTGSAMSCGCVAEGGAFGDEEEGAAGAGSLRPRSTTTNATAAMATSASTDAVEMTSLRLAEDGRPCAA